jgi:hypothetical protein
MTYKVLRKYKNIGGDWSVCVNKGEYTLSFVFPTEPTDEIIDQCVLSYKTEEEENVVEE